jgi:nitrate/nitrite transporter NarK
MFEYWFCIIVRSASVSKLFPPEPDGTVLGGLAIAVAVVEFVGPVNVEFAVLDQSTWNFHTCTLLVKLPTEAKRFGVPVGGVPACRRALLGSSVK